MKPILAIADHAAGPSKPARLPAAVAFAVVLAGVLLLAAILDDEPMDGSTLFKPTNDLRLLLDVAMPALRAFAESVARRLLENAAAAFEAAAASGTSLLAIVAPSPLPGPSRRRLAMPSTGRTIERAQRSLVDAFIGTSTGSIVDATAVQDSHARRMRP